ncbi:dienelactone hydrolase family protein [bacterium]|nr:dienelactone hydrolase family protein [bacterium]
MGQISDFLYAYQAQSDAERAIIILPEIFGVKDFTRELAGKVQIELGWNGYVLDHFYAVTGEVQTFAYDDMSGMEIMERMTGELFLPLLAQAVGMIQEAQPKLKHLAVWGFCFGGKLAYLSGVNPHVTDIVSCYGGASVQPGFYAGDSVVQALARARYADKSLKILGVYGEHDPMIPAADREKISTLLTESKISHQIKVYDAGHAFFNEDRADRYVEAAAKAAWNDVSNWLKR